MQLKIKSYSTRKIKGHISKTDKAVKSEINQSQNKNCLWRPCLLTDRDEMSSFIEEAILVSDWSISKKSSPLKPFGQMNQNLVGSIYGRLLISSRSVNKHGHHRQLFFLVISKKSSPLPTKFGFIWPSSYRGEDF
jgi:hypothetical protein